MMQKIVYKYGMKKLPQMSSAAFKAQLNYQRVTLCERFQANGPLGIASQRMFSDTIQKQQRTPRANNSYSNNELYIQTNVKYTQDAFHQRLAIIQDKVFNDSKHNKQSEKKVFLMIYLVAKAYNFNHLKFSKELLQFLVKAEELTFKNFPTDALSNDFRHLIQSLLFSTDFIETQTEGNRLYNQTLEFIRGNYNKLLEDESHKAYTINKICRVLSPINKPDEQSLLKSISVEAAKNLKEMSFDQMVNTVNMIFPYIHREQINLWNRQRIQMQNMNPKFSEKFVDELNTAREQGVFLKICDKISDKLNRGALTRDEFFQIAQFSYFPHKLTGANTNFRFFKHYDENVMKFISKNFNGMDDSQVASIFFLYAHNMWEAQERFTNQHFFEDIFQQLATQKLRDISNQTLVNIVRSIGTLSYRNENTQKIFKELRRRIEIQPEMISIQTLFSTCINVKDYEELLSQKEDYFSKFLQQYKQQSQGYNIKQTQLVLLARGLAKAEHYDNEIFSTLFQEFKSILKSPPNSLRSEIIQLNTFLLNDVQDNSLSKENRALIEQFQKDQKFDQYKVTTLKHNLHNKVQIELKKRKIQFQEEAKLEFNVDFYVPESKTIIEVEGPSHYIAPDRIINKSTEARYRILKKKGYKIVQVPYFINDPNIDGPKLEDLINEI